MEKSFYELWKLGINVIKAKAAADFISKNGDEPANAECCCHA